jgi:hypothetical protein
MASFSITDCFLVALEAEAEAEEDRVVEEEEVVEGVVVEAEDAAVWLRFAMTIHDSSSSIYWISRTPSQQTRLPLWTTLLYATR